LAAIDIKRIIEKTEFDIIRPQWILDCVGQGELVPLRKKYFFHASRTRVEDGEYDLSDSEDDSAPRAPTTSSSQVDEDEVARALAMSKTPGSEVDSELSEWFQVEPNDLKISGKVDDSETEEDNDSDNHDLNEPDMVEDDDDWFQLPKENHVKSQAKVASSATMKTESSVGVDAAGVHHAWDSIVGLAPSLTFINVQLLRSGESGNKGESQDGRR